MKQLLGVAYRLVWPCTCNTIYLVELLRKLNDNYLYLLYLP